MKGTLRSPYQPCKLMNKILPEKFIDFFFRRKQNKRNDDQFTKIENIENNETFLPFHNDVKANSISGILDESLHKNEYLQNAIVIDRYAE